MAAAGQFLPAEHMVGRYVGFQVVGIDLRGRPFGSARFVLQHHIRFHGLAIQQRAVNSIVGTVSDLGQQFIAPVFGHVKRNIDP